MCAPQAPSGVKSLTQFDIEGDALRFQVGATLALTSLLVAKGLVEREEVVSAFSVAADLESVQRVRLLLQAMAEAVRACEETSTAEH